MTELGRPGALGRLWAANEAKLAITIVLVIVLTALVDRNHTYWNDPADSAEQVLRNAAMLGIYALGSAVVIISGGIDLSTGSMIAFSGSACAMIMTAIDPQGMQDGDLDTSTMVAGIAGTLVVGFLVGSLHAWLITVIRLPPFIATLATLVGLRSLARILVENFTAAFTPRQNTQINVIDESFRELGYDVKYPAAIFAALALLTWLLLTRTVLGRHLIAMGGNEEAARLSGIRTDRLKWFAYCFSAMAASIAGVLFIGNEAMADPQTQGQMAELNAIAACVVGGCSLQGGVGTIPGVVLGCFFLRIVTDAVSKIIKAGASLYEGIVVGIVVVVAVAFSQVARKGQTRKQFFPGALGWTAALVLGLLGASLSAVFGGRWVALGVGVGIFALALILKAYERDRAESILTPGE
jgi:ribose/xylose/arabinose/galactoside ABC-type transport system permease subunit